MKPLFAGCSAFLCLLLLAAGSGCIFSPDKKGGGPPPPPSYHPNTSPTYVLLNLIEAYKKKDGVGYISLYDSLYTGQTQNPWDPDQIQVRNFTRADEAAHIDGLSRAVTAVVDIQPKQAFLTYRDNGDPEGWMTIQDPYFSFEITDGTTIYRIPVADGVDLLEFKFIPYPSATDTTWKIIKWTEIVNREPPTPASISSPSASLTVRLPRK